MRIGKVIILIVILLCFLVAPLCALTFPYDKDLSLVSDITMGLSLVAPGFLALNAPPSDYLSVGVSYASTMAISYFGIRSPLKANIERERPYVGETSRPSDTSEDYDSFPSGHTLMAFAAAAYTQTLSNLWYPDSKSMKVVSIATWTLASATAVLRVVSGNHYVSDVLAGAAIGSVVGFLGPYLTDKIFGRSEQPVQLYIGPTVGMQVSF